MPLDLLADALGRFLALDSARIFIALALLLAALYARRILGFGQALGRGMSIGVVVLVVLAVGIASGVLDPQLATARGLVASTLEAVKGVVS